MWKKPDYHSYMFDCRAGRNSYVSRWGQIYKCGMYVDVHMGNGGALLVVVFFPVLFFVHMSVCMQNCKTKINDIFNH